MWTLDEFADFACMARRTIDDHRAKRDGSFPSEYRPAGRPLFKRVEVEEWLEERALTRRTAWRHPEWKAPPRS